MIKGLPIIIVILAIPQTSYISKYIIMFTPQMNKNIVYKKILGYTIPFRIFF